MITSVTFALLAAMLEASACPKPIDSAKLHRMLNYTARPYFGAKDNYETRAALIALGKHAAQYACRKKMQ